MDLHRKVHFEEPTCEHFSALVGGHTGYTICLRSESLFAFRASCLRSARAMRERRRLEHVTIVGRIGEASSDKNGSESKVRLLTARCACCQTDAG
jgi:hypothetical protein